MCLFVIFGIGKTTEKYLGQLKPQICNNCNNKISFRIKEIKFWFSLFFIPIIPYKTEYFIYCPICSRGSKLNKKELEKIKFYE